MPQRCHLHLDGDEAELLDRAGAADVAPPDERNGFAGPFDERVVDRVLQHRGVTVVVLRRHDHEAVGPIERFTKPRDLRARVVTQRVGRRLAVEHGQRMITEIDELHGHVVACAEALRECTTARPATSPVMSR